MDGRDLLSYMDDNDDYYPIAVMTPSGLRVVEVTNTDASSIYFEFPTTNPNDYRVGVQGSGIALVEPSARLLASDPPYLIMPLMRANPGEGADFYEGFIMVVNAAGELDEGGAEGTLPWIYPESYKIWKQT